VRLAMPLRTNISPNRTKNGIAMRVPLFEDDQTTCPNPRIRGKGLKNVSIPKANRKSTIHTGIDNASRNNRPADVKRIIVHLQHQLCC